MTEPEPLAPGHLPIASVTSLPDLTPSFESFFRANHPRVVALVTALCGRSAAEDVAQEAFVRAHRNWGVVADYDRPDAWVRRVAINIAVSTGRRRSTEARAIGRLAARRHIDVVEPAPVRDDELWRAVRSLPRRQAAAVALRYVEDLSITDIADALGCAEGTAKALLHQGRTALAARLGEDPGGDDR
jgi:RNA polymerase sigma-70 factor, ECF subfamily